MRWKVFFYINPKDEIMYQTSGLKMLDCPLKIKETVSLERYLWDLANKSKSLKSWQQLSKSVKRIYQS